MPLAELPAEDNRPAVARRGLCREEEDGGELLGALGSRLGGGGGDGPTGRRSGGSSSSGLGLKPLAVGSLQRGGEVADKEAKGNRNAQHKSTARHKLHLIGFSEQHCVERAAADLDGGDAGEVADAIVHELNRRGLKG